MCGGHAAETKCIAVGGTKKNTNLTPKQTLWTEHGQTLLFGKLLNCCRFCVSAFEPAAASEWAWYFVAGEWIDPPTVWTVGSKFKRNRLLTPSEFTWAWIQHLEGDQWRRTLDKSSLRSKVFWPVGWIVQGNLAIHRLANRQPRIIPATFLTISNVGFDCNGKLTHDEILFFFFFFHLRLICCNSLVVLTILLAAGRALTACCKREREAGPSESTLFTNSRITFGWLEISFYYGFKREREETIRIKEEKRLKKKEKKEGIYLYSTSLWKETRQRRKEKSWREENAWAGQDQQVRSLSLSFSYLSMVMEIWSREPGI